MNALEAFSIHLCWLSCSNIPIFLFFTKVPLPLYTFQVLMASFISIVLSNRLIHILREKQNGTQGTSAISLYIRSKRVYRT